MKNLFEGATVEEVKGRMAQLRPDSERQWGKMNPAQALAHCSAAMEMAMGEKFPPRILIGRLLGRLAKKSMIVNEKPMPRNSGTDKSLVVVMRGTSWRRDKGYENSLTALQRAGLGHARSIRTSFSGR